MMFRLKKRQFNLYLAYGFKTFMITEKKEQGKVFLKYYPVNNNIFFVCVWFARYYIVIKHDI